MCPEYYKLRAKLEAIYRRAEVVYTGPVGKMALLKEIRFKLSAHIKSCPVCQENMDLARNQAHKPQEYIDDDV